MNRTRVGLNTVVIGDCREILRRWIAAGVRVQMCVTSPPYWGLRDYGTAKWEGGNDQCDHRQNVARHDGGRINVDGFNGSSRPDSNKGSIHYRDVCGKCGARRIDHQIGLEPTIAEYAETMVEVFRLVREVLADDGTLWLNLGDTYSSGGREIQTRDTLRDAASGKQDYLNGTAVRAPNQPGIKPKDLCMIPARVALALQADGWYLRQDIIYSKPNPMPESVTDRCTKAHEYLFLLSKRERYYYDAAAIAEPSLRAGSLPKGGALYRERIDKRIAVFRSGNKPVDEVRNRRSVWEITTQPYTDAHFAVMPQALVEPCIMAGSRIGDVVLDPFMGSGTVARVAQDLGRKWIGCELNPEYGRLVTKRAAQQRLVSYTESEARPRILPKERRLIGVQNG